MIERLSVVDLPSGKRHDAIQRAPVLSSAGGPWRGFLVEQHSNISIELIEKAATDHRVIVQIRDEAVIEIKQGSQYRACRLTHLPPGLNSLSEK